MRNPRRIGIGLLLFLGLYAASSAAPSAADLEKTSQAKAVRAQLKAAAAGDFEAYKKVTMADVITKMEKQLKEAGKSPKDGLQFVTMLLPQEIHFTAMTVNGKTASLSLTGKSDGQAQKGTIELAQEGGQWKVGVWDFSPAK